MLLSRLYLRAVFWLSLLSIVCLLISLLVLDTIRIAASTPEPRTHTRLSTFGSTSVRNIYIASIHYNVAPFLATSWSPALTKLVDYLGPKHVYVSAVDGGSTDGTNIELLALKEALDERGVGNSFDLGVIDYRKFQGSGGSPRSVGTTQLDLRSLVKFRNRAMKPLMSLMKTGRDFNTVLWIDDNVHFSTQSIVALLDTNNGSFAAACSMTQPHLDSRVLRDDQGFQPASPSWPWFRSPWSRSAAQDRSVIPVFSCWDGLVAFDAEPFVSEPPLRFRTIDGSLARHNLEASERCLIHADNYVADRGVWTNPNVQVTTSQQGYPEDPIPSGIAMFAAIWANRLARWTGAANSALQRRIVRAKLKEWERDVSEGDLGRHEPGLPCLMVQAEDRSL